MFEKHYIQPDDLGGLEFLPKKMDKPAISIDELESICGGDELLEMLLDEMLDKCAKYTSTVADYQRHFLEAENGVIKDLEYTDKQRTIIHDSTIDSINILSRALGRANKDNQWVGNFAGNRAAYGKFAILITLSRIKDVKID